MKVDGIIDKFKPWLVAKSFALKHSLDYFNTYLPVIRTITIRALIALALAHKFVSHYMNVEATFLNKELDEEFYMHNQKDLYYLVKKRGCIN